MLGVQKAARPCDCVHCVDVRVCLGRFLWFQNTQWTGRPVDIELHAGDVYLMSEKAVGTDWRQTKGGILTLRHAAGCAKYVRGPLSSARPVVKCAVLQCAHSPSSPFRCPRPMLANTRRGDCFA